eukprot:gnl/TRDRNA2_/TRDRNA2_167464_c0_seq1.p1 gnl/TRDRNA2_/TRDRNA2_167464_c0~~gnl/TRDRNA2_/TRDRNA2_167464_c0_seq1.p1  ORF type:complete len:1354 (-),score=188.23 gnl/TRDRNA2_/TRDRNA2_167464_c0_seq1:26-3547(-)
MVEGGAGKGAFDGNIVFDRLLVEPSDMLQVVAVLLNYAERLMNLALHLVAPSKDYRRLERSQYMRLYLGAILALLDEGWLLLCALSLIVKNLICLVHAQRQCDAGASGGAGACPEDKRPPWLLLANHMLAAQPRFIWFHTSMCDFVAHCHQLRCAGFPELGPHIPTVPQSLLNLFADLGKLVQSHPSEKSRGGSVVNSVVRSAESLSSISTTAGLSTPQLHLSDGQRPQVHGPRLAGCSRVPVTTLDLTTGTTRCGNQTAPVPPLAGPAAVPESEAPQAGWEPSACVLDAFRTVDSLQRLSPPRSPRQMHAIPGDTVVGIEEVKASGASAASTPAGRLEGTRSTGRERPALRANRQMSPSAHSPARGGRNMSAPAPAGQRGASARNQSPVAGSLTAAVMGQHICSSPAAEERSDSAPKGYLFFSDDSDPFEEGASRHESEHSKSPRGLEGCGAAASLGDQLSSQHQSPTAETERSQSKQRVAAADGNRPEPLNGAICGATAEAGQSQSIAWPPQQAGDDSQTSWFSSDQQVPHLPSMPQHPTPALAWPPEQSGISQASWFPPDQLAPPLPGRPQLPPWAAAICQRNKGRGGADSSAHPIFRGPLWQPPDTSCVEERRSMVLPPDGPSSGSRRAASPGKSPVAAVAAQNSPTAAGCKTDFRPTPASGIPLNPFDLSASQLRRVTDAVRGSPVAASTVPVPDMWPVNGASPVAATGRSSTPVPPPTLLPPDGLQGVDRDDVHRVSSPQRSLANGDASPRWPSQAQQARAASPLAPPGKFGEPLRARRSASPLSPFAHQNRQAPATPADSRKANVRPGSPLARAGSPPTARGGRSGRNGGSAVTPVGRAVSPPPFVEPPYHGGVTPPRAPRQAPSQPQTPVAPVAGGLLQEHGCASEWEVDSAEVTLEELVGSGTTADVHRGTWHGTDVAVKKLKQPASSGASLSVEFGRELSVLLRLRHPNLVLFMGVCAQGFPMIISEFCAGGTVFTLLHQRSDLTLPWSQRLRIAVDTARGMNFLHKRQVVHRDLKSLNLLLQTVVATSDDTPQVKISDFGLSRLRSETEQGQAYMTSGAGTYHWMAPEVLDGHSYDEKVDVYSYGICLFEVIARRIPYDNTGLEPISIAVAVSKGRRPDLSLMPRNCPADLRMTMECCWAHCPTGRPAFDTILETLKLVQCP